METNQQIPKVLVVDNSRINLVVNGKILEMAGLQVLKASSGMEAFGLLQREAGISMVLMDLEMPEMDGYATTQLIRNSGEPFAGIIIAALSASDDAYTKERALKSGMNFYLTKPLSAEAVKKCIAAGNTAGAGYDKNSPEYNLEYLLMVSGGNPAMLEELSSHILTDAPIILEDALKAAEEQNFDLVANHLHKAKSQLKIFGTDSLVNRIIDLELRAKSENLDKTPILADLSHVLSETRRIFLLISNELNKYK
jgi:CheY-like chemotaxis protein